MGCRVQKAIRTVSCKVTMKDPLEDYTVCLNEARLELAEFLTKHPHLIPFQNKLEEDMNKSDNRLNTLSFYLQDNLEQLTVELLLLQYKLDCVLR